MQEIKILAISSLPAHKTAGLKALIGILGSAVLPIPSVILSGVNSLSGVVKQEIDIAPLMESALDIARKEDQRLYIFIGCLSSAEHILQIRHFIAKHRTHISGIIADPISGDNNQPYINASLIKHWPEILAIADIALPNMTELKMYSGLAQTEQRTTKHLSAFESKFPSLNYLVTSYIEETKKGVLVKEGEDRQLIRHHFFDTRMDGTGDVLAAYFLKFYLLEEAEMFVACRKAIEATLRILKKSIKNNLIEMSIH